MNSKFIWMILKRLGIIQRKGFRWRDKNEVNEGISVFDVLEKLVKGDNYYCYSKTKKVTLG